MEQKFQGYRFIFSCILILVFFSQFNCHATAGLERKGLLQMPSFIDIGVIQNLSSPFGTMINLCIEMAVSDFYSAHANYKTRLRPRFKNIQDVLDVDLAVLELVEHDQVHGVLEPQGSSDETFVSEIGRKFQVPIFSFTPRGSLQLGPENPYFLQTYVDDAIQAKALAAICQGFTWNEAVMVFEDTDAGFRFLSRLSQEFRDAGIRLAHLAAIPVTADEGRLAKELESLNQNQIVKVFLVHVDPTLGVQLFTLAGKIGMMGEGYAWVITDRLSNFLGSVSPAVRAWMEGVVGVRPHVPFSQDLERFKEKWKRDGSVLNVHCLWAYDTVTALANSLEKIRLENTGTTSLGPLFQKELSGNRFVGLSGYFEFLDGRLKISTMEIFNVVGSGERHLGFWTFEGGITKELRKAVWPGDSLKKPRGWSIPPSGLLRVGLPCNSGTPQFVNITAFIDRLTNEVDATGFVVDLFLAALDVLPIQLNHRFYCYGNVSNIDWSYDDLLRLIPEKFDMVVADVTIWAPRTSYVDFSLPYLESGIILVVKKKTFDMWIFTRPLRWDLWLAIFVSCVSIGLVICVLERRATNANTGDDPFNMPYVAPIAVLAFQERGMVLSNCSKFVLFCWVVMAFILMQSFTANLSAILTVDQLKFAFSKDYNLGFRSSSFTEEFLLKNLNIDKSRLKGYSTDKEFDDAMSRGSKKDGVDAIFDEIPYMKLFMNKYKSEYKTVGPTYRNAGFGFAFPVGSPLVANFSRAILNITKRGLREDYERKYFGAGYSSLSEQETSSLTFYDFSGLFIVVASAAVFAVICSETEILSRFNNTAARLYRKRYGSNVEGTVGAVFREAAVLTESKRHELELEPQEDTDADEDIFEDALDYEGDDDR